MNLWKKKSFATQFHIRNDGDFEFRKALVEDNFQQEKNQEEVVNAWMHFFKLAKRFTGYRSLKPCMATICFDGDILLDPFRELKDSEKPQKGRELVKDFVTDIATAKCYRHEHGKHSSTIDRLVLFFGSVMIVEVFIILLEVAKK